MNKKQYNRGITGGIVIGIAFFLVFVMLVGLCLQVWAPNEKWKPSEWFRKNEQTEQACNGEGNPVIDEAAQEHGVKLMSAVMPLAEGEKTYQSSYTLTATVLPENADNKKVMWSMAWENPASEWATGKNIAEYFSLTYGENVDVSQSDGTQNEVVATTKEPFGEPVVVTVCSDENEELFARKRFQFVKQIKKCDFTVANGGFNVSLFGVRLGSDSTYTITPSYTLTDGTITPVISTVITLSLSDTFLTETGFSARGKHVLTGESFVATENFYKTLYGDFIAGLGPTLPTKEQFENYLKTSTDKKPCRINVSFNLFSDRTTNLFQGSYGVTKSYGVSFVSPVTSVSINDTADFCF